VADIRIGPCGHLYGYNEKRWQFIYLDTAGELVHKKVNIDLSGGANLNDCTGCAMRVDQVGNLWYRGEEGKIFVYNPFKNRVTLKTKNLVQIDHVAFKKGRVYGLSTNKGAPGIYILLQSKKWKLAIKGYFTSFEAIIDGVSEYDFVVLKTDKVNDRDTTSVHVYRTSDGAS